MSGLFDQVVNYSPPLLTTGQVNYKGTWNASTNSPTLVTPPAVTSKGDYYVVSAAGTQFTISFAVGDWIISNGAAWEKVDLTDAVSSVHGRTGAVVGVSTDYSAVGITNTAIGASSPSTGAFTTLSAASLTSPAASNLTLGTGSAGTALTFTSATGAATFAAPVTTSAGFVSNTTSAAALINTPTSTSQRFLQLANSTNGNIYVGVESSVAGAFFTGSTAYEPVIYTPAASLFLRTSSGTVRTNGNFKVEGTTASTSTTTGALIVSGGAGFAGNVHSGGTGNFSGVITSLGGNAGVQIYDRTNGVSDAWLMSAINGPSSVLSFVNNGNSELTVGKGGTVTARGALTAASGTMATSFGGITTGLTLNNASTNATAGRGVQIDFTGTSGGTLARIIGQTTTTANTTGSLTFQTASAGVYGTRMTIAANGDTSILSTTASTSTTTGSLVNSGGFGNAGAAYFGSTITASGVIASSTGLTATSGNALQVNNSLNDAAATIFNSGTTGASVINFRTASTTRFSLADTVATFTSTTASTSTTTGSLINAGGFGNAGDIWGGGKARIGGNSLSGLDGGVGADFAVTSTSVANVAGFLQGSAGRGIMLYQNGYVASTTGGNWNVAATTAGASMSVGTNGAASGGTLSFTAPTLLSVLNTTASTSTTTGSLINAGGFGNAGAAYFGGLVSASHSLTVIGGAAIGIAAFQASGNQASQLIANLTSSISGAGTSFGLRVAAGTNASDYALRVLNQAGTLDYLFVKGDGAVSISNGLTVGSTTLLTTSVSLTNGAGSSVGTLTNAPSVGNPTKWIPIVDNGTTRYIPCW